ncbi:MAG: hypothetical protein JNM89_01450 [Hyphomicrobiaceae bacterium]|nr:hypothetical protein [Hyphomicrobiaceae bacterium]
MTANDLARDPSIVTPYGEETRRPAPLSETLAGAMPSFLDGAALDRLKDALHAAIAPPGEPEGGKQASNGGAFVFGSGLASVLPSLRQMPIFGGTASSASIDLSGTLTDARRDAGEARVLSEEVRSRAEELSRRFAIGAWAIGSNAAASEIAIKVADEPAASGWRPDPAVVSPPVVALPGTVTTLATAAAAAPRAQGDAGQQAETAASRPVPELEGRMGLGHGNVAPPAPTDQATTPATVSSRPVTTLPIALTDSPSLAPAMAPLPARPRSAKRKSTATPAVSHGQPPRTATALGLLGRPPKP